MKRKRVRIKSKQLQKLLEKGERQEVRKDFFELLRRAANHTPVSS